MFHLPAEVFSLSGEAVVLIRGSKIVYTNRHAVNILHEDCVGKTVKSIFGPELANCQASYFTMDVYLYNSYYTACVSQCDQYRVLFLHKPDPAADYIGEKFWLAMRDGLMNLEVRVSVASLLDTVKSDKFTIVIRGIYAESTPHYFDTKLLISIKNCCRLCTTIIFLLAVIIGLTVWSG